MLDTAQSTLLLALHIACIEPMTQWLVLLNLDFLSRANSLVLLFLDVCSEILRHKSISISESSILLNWNLEIGTG